MYPQAVSSKDGPANYVQARNQVPESLDMESVYVDSFTCYSTYGLHHLVPAKLVSRPYPTSGMIPNSKTWNFDRLGEVHIVDFLMTDERLDITR